MRSIGGRGRDRRVEHPFERIARAWNDRGLSYAVAHGLTRTPGVYGRDLDVVVRAADLDEALDIGARELADAGFELARPPRLWGERIVAIRPDDPGRMLELHLLDGLGWRNVRLAGAPRATMSKGPFSIDPWISVAKRVLHPALAGDLERFRGRSDELVLSQPERAALLERLAALAGGSHARAFHEAVERADPEAIVDVARRTGRSMMLRAAVRSPIASALGFARVVERRVAPPFRPCAPVVALVGPDGAGKSTAIDQLSRTDGWVFTAVERRHWRPGLLPELSALNPFPVRLQRRSAASDEKRGRRRTGSTTPVDSPSDPTAPRRRPGRLGWLRMVYYAADAWLGGWVLDRAAAGRQRLVLYDRCLLDMVVDPARYGLRDGGCVERLWSVLPRPDRVVLLAGSPERIVGRKPELTVSEVTAQIEVWRSLVRAGLVHEVVNADMAASDVTAELRRVIAEAMLERNPATPDAIFDGGSEVDGAPAAAGRERCAS